MWAGPHIIYSGDSDESPTISCPLGKQVQNITFTFSLFLIFRTSRDPVLLRNVPQEVARQHRADERSAIADNHDHFIKQQPRRQR